MQVSNFRPTEIWAEVMNVTGASNVAQWLEICLPVQEIRVQFLDGENPLEKEMATHSCIFAWEITWTEDLVGYSPWGHKELDTT